MSPYLHEIDGVMTLDGGMSTGCLNDLGSGLKLKYLSIHFAAGTIANSRTPGRLPYIRYMLIISAS